MTFELAVEDERWIADGRHDKARWAANALGIWLHDKQIEFVEALERDEATFYFLWWANRTGKTVGVVVDELHTIFYKPGIPEPTTEHQADLWQNEDYRILHAAPIGGLATIAWERVKEISKGTDPSQRDDRGERREAKLGSMFVATTERDSNGAVHMVTKCLPSNGTVDYRSTEGGGGRLEGRAWRRLYWDEWPQQDAADKPTAIRSVLTRLENRASDFDAKIVLAGTITPETEHIAKEYIRRCEDPADIDWWGSSAARWDNPSASTKAMELAKREMDPEDYARTIAGIPGGVRDRLFPATILEPVFNNDLPRFSPPHPMDGVKAEPVAAGPMQRNRSRRRTNDDDEPLPVRSKLVPREQGSPYFYIHAWDLAIAAAANVGHVWRLPADLVFGWKSDEEGRRLIAIEGVKRVEVPGSRTLTTAEIVHTIEETFLPYGGRIVLDTTDAHGKSIYRELRRAGYPVDDFTFNERDEQKVLLKDRAIKRAGDLMTEGMSFRRDAKGEIVYVGDVPVHDPTVEFGVIRLPREWVKAHDQLTVLRVDDDKQTKDEAMVVLMASDTAYRMRRGRTRRVTSQPFAVFGGGRRH